MGNNFIIISGIAIIRTAGEWGGAVAFLHRKSKGNCIWHTLPIVKAMTTDPINFFNCKRKPSLLQSWPIINNHNVVVDEASFFHRTSRECGLCSQPETTTFFLGASSILLWPSFELLSLWLSSRMRPGNRASCRQLIIILRLSAVLFLRWRWRWPRKSY